MLKIPAPLISASEPYSRPLGAKDSAALVELLGEWTIPEGREQAVHDMALAGLNQVKASTEYDDARALLTIVAFLTALAGAVFNRFSSTYELPQWGAMISHWDEFWPAVTYAMFGAYAVIVAISAYVIFGAMKPPSHLSDPRGRRMPAPNVQNFHARIAGTHPQDWGRNLVELANDSAVGSDSLTAHYAKHYILETYLVADQIALKLKKAAPAVRWLQLSMLFLAGFIISYGATLVFLAPQNHSAMTG
jgi:hypothetical protein